MASPDFSRSKSLNIIPSRKLQEKLLAVEQSEESLEVKNLKIISYNRFAESNIPVEYWDLKMEKDFVGDPRLLNKYNEIVGDLKNTYINGTSVCFAGAHGLGKQISLETELPTPYGFIKLKDLKVGDKLFDEKGNICNVIELHPINLSPESYKLIFDDGSEVDACADHLWLTWDRYSRCDKENGKSKVRNTKEILNTLKLPGPQQITNHSIECCKPINYDEKKQIIDPYVLGCWLGDGTTNTGDITSMDAEILDQILQAGYSVNIKKCTISRMKINKSRVYRIGNLKKNKGLLKAQLENYSLICNKHIPDDYLYGSYNQRLSLLQGLLDTDGSCNPGGGIEYCTVLPNLANQVLELINSLGIKSKIKINESWLYDKRCKDRYRITFTTKLPVFRLSRKLKNIRLDKKQLSRTEHRFINKVIPIDPIPMRCITVDSPSHLFLITRSFIPTHNTMAATNILKKVNLKGYSAQYTTLSDVVNVLTQGSSEEKFLARRELCMVDFLTIDEWDSRFFSTENAADLYARTLESIFRTRISNKLPTFMCTNSPNVLEAFNGPLKESIGSLISGYMKTFIVFGEDIRSRK